jgi:hypothetical protein
MIACSIYLAITRQYVMQEEVREFEYRMTAAAAIVKNEIGLAGYIGCPMLENGFPIRTQTDEVISAETKLTGTGNQITVKHAAIPPASVIDIMSEGAVIKTDLGQRFKRGQVILIADCRHAEMARVSHVTRGGYFQFIAIETPLSTLFDAGAEISRLEINRYYVRGNALVTQSSNGRESSIIEGIQGITFTYHYLEGKLIGVEFKLQGQQGKQIKNWYSYASVS